MPQRVVIIGAGPGGLAAALLLGRAGLDVTVLERLPRVGGRTSAIETRGFRFDLGPTFFLYPRALERIYAAVGHDLRAEVPMTRLDPQYRLVFGSGGDLLATPDMHRMEQELARLAPGDAPALRRFLADNRIKLERFTPVLENEFPSWRKLLTPEMLRMLPQLRPWLSLDAELGRYFRDPRVRLAFSFQSKYLGMSPFNCPSLFSILSFLEYEHGVYHPAGGCSAVMEHMAAIAEEFDVDVRLGEEVTALEFRGRRVVGVVTDRGAYSADAVVINADFAHAMTRLVPDRLRRRWTDRQIARKKFSCSTFMMYLGIEGLYDQLAHHTIYMAADYAKNLHDIDTDHVLSDDPSLYVQNAGVTDELLAPPGKSTLYVLAPVTHIHGNVDWSAQRQRFRALVLRQLRDRLGLADVEQRIVFERIVTPADWANDYAVYRGATFNLAHTLGQMLHLRPRNRFNDLDGVYLVGGGTHPGSGLPVIFESSRITSRLLLDDFAIDRRWIDEPTPLEVAEPAT